MEDVIPMTRPEASNSGGPLFDASGRVIGITSSIASLSQGGSSAGSIGLGFAIPSNLAKRIADELITDGVAQHAFLGVSMSDGTATLGDPLLTSCTTAPSLVVSPSVAVPSLMLTPRKACWATPSVISSSAIRFARLDGMAKPRPIEPALPPP